MVTPGAPARFLAGDAVHIPVRPPELHRRLPVAAGRTRGRCRGVAAKATADRLRIAQGSGRPELEDVVVGAPTGRGCREARRGIALDRTTGVNPAPDNGV